MQIIPFGEVKELLGDRCRPLRPHAPQTEVNYSQEVMEGCLGSCVFSPVEK